MKKLVSMICVFVMIASLCIPVSAVDGTKHYYLIKPSSFTTLGDWQITPRNGAFESTVLDVPDEGSSLNRQPAKTSLHLPNGTYYVWVRSIDFPEYLPGYRKFKLSLNGTDTSPSGHTYFGQHGVGQNPGTLSQNTAIGIFWWEKAKDSVTVTNGRLDIGVTAYEFWAKLDAIIVTDDASYTPPNPYVAADNLTYSYDTVPAKLPAAGEVTKVYNELLSYCTVEDFFEYEDEIAFPAYAQQMGTQQGTMTRLSNENFSVMFRLAENDGKRYVLRQTTVGDNTVDSFLDGLGYLILYADTATDFGNRLPLFKGSYNGTEFGTDNVFKGGYPSWVVMSSITQVSSDSVRLDGENEFASVSALWTAEPGAMEPTVQLTVTAKKSGAYSYGVFYSPKEFAMSNVKFIQVPYRYHELGMPNNSVLVPESQSTSNLTQVTTVSGYKVANKDVTYGIYVDGKSISSAYNGVINNSAASRRWVKNAPSYTSEFPASYGGNRVIDTADDQSNFGLSIRGKNGGAQPALFAPIMSSADCHMQAGTVYSLTYKPMATVSNPSVSSWYDSYSHVIKDFLNVTDYRGNYFSSMTDTIFNIHDLLRNDHYSGWSADGKAHYNMEARNIVSNAAPLAYLQEYLLTEDQAMYESRTIPSMEYLLSRPSMHYAYAGPIQAGTGLSNARFGSSSAFLNMFSATPEGFSNIGLTSDAGATPLGNSSYYGAYRMSLGQMPYYKNAAASNYMGTQIAQANVASVQNPSEHLWKYRASGVAADRNTAQSHANSYITKRVNVPYDQPAAEADFIFQTYYPNIHALLEMYEEFKDNKYLTAAQECAHRLITTLWSNDMPASGETYTVPANKINDYITTVRGANMYWHGDRRYRLGSTEPYVSPYEYLPVWKSDIITQTDQTVPAWVLARTGLGIEQSSTFMYHNANIIMSTWAADLMRIAYLTGDTTLEAYARNAIVGRYANYPGYYQMEYYTFPYTEQFPYKGPDTTNIYYHHIPALLAALQDFLISQSYCWSGAAVDFPNVRSQGYAWFSNRYYGFAPGKVYNENNMWLWMKRGLVTVDNPQIDWFAARKEGRVAFVLMNESQETVTTTLTFGDALGLDSAGFNSVVYTPSGHTSQAITNKATTLTIPPRTTVAIAFAANVHAPSYASAYGNDITEMGSTYQKASVMKTDDVKGYTVQIDPSSYHAYICVAHRPQTYVYQYNNQTQNLSVDPTSGISQAVLTYKIGNGAWQTVTDNVYPFEFDVKVEDPTKDFTYKVALTRSSTTKEMTDYGRLAGALYQEPEMPLEALGATEKRGTTVSATSNPTISGWGTTNNTAISQTGNCFAFLKMYNNLGEDVSATLVYAIVDANGRFKRIAKIVQATVPATATASAPVNVTTVTSDPIVLTDADLGCHFVVYVLSDLSTLIPYMGKYNFATGKAE